MHARLVMLVVRFIFICMIFMLQGSSTFVVRIPDRVDKGRLKLFDDFPRQQKIIIAFLLFLRDSLKF